MNNEERNTEKQNENKKERNNLIEQATEPYARIKASKKQNKRTSEIE